MIFFSFLTVVALLVAFYLCYCIQASKIQARKNLYRNRFEARNAQESRVDANQLLEDGIVHSSYGTTA